MERSAGCARCETQCVAAAPGTGRTVHLHPQEALLQQARALQQSEAFGEYRQRRVVVERRLARLVQLGIRQSRCFGRAKTKFQLYLAATVANLNLVAAKAGLPANTGCGSSVGRALRAGTIRSALEIVPARLAQILILALLTAASLPKYISRNKAFRPDFQAPSARSRHRRPSPRWSDRSVRAVSPRPSPALSRPAGRMRPERPTRGSSVSSWPGPAMSASPGCRLHR